MKDNVSWEYTFANGKKLRRGYTTGSCAAAAARAATRMLFTGKPVETIEIETPKGIPMSLNVFNHDLKPVVASCSIRKDSGDDPDITNGIHIYATSEMLSFREIQVIGGEGIGKVTKPGLQVEVGKHAINPVPMKMILHEVEKEVPEGKGVRVTLRIPEGAELAKKTLNPRLGIVGGLSILGTTGIVEPMSEEAFKDSLAVELKMALQGNLDRIVLSPGNQGVEISTQKLGIPEEHIIKTSNFVGFMLDKCCEFGVKKVLFVGHIGKLIKVSAGIFHTHSRTADARFEIFAANAALFGADAAFIQKLQECITTDEMSELLDQLGIEGMFDKIAANVSQRSMQYTYGQIQVGTVLYTFKRGIIGMDENAKQLLEEFR